MDKNKKLKNKHILSLNWEKKGSSFVYLDDCEGLNPISAFPYCNYYELIKLSNGLWNFTYETLIGDRHSRNCIFKGVIYGKKHFKRLMKLAGITITSSEIEKLLFFGGYEGQECLEIDDNYTINYKYDTGLVVDDIIDEYIGAPGSPRRAYIEYNIPITSWTNTYDETYRIEGDKGVLVEVKLDRYSKLGELYTIAPITDISMLYVVDKCGSEIDDGSNYIYNCILKPLGHSIQPKLVDSYLKIGQPIK